MAVARAAATLLGIVGGLALAQLRQLAKDELGRSCVVGVAGRARVVRHDVALLAGQRGVRGAGVQVNRMRSDSRIRSVGCTEQVTRWGGARQVVAGPVRLAVTSRTARELGHRVAVGAALQTAGPEQAADERNGQRGHGR